MRLKKESTVSTISKTLALMLFTIMTIKELGLDWIKLKLRYQAVLVKFALKMVINN
jgi:hypothetical protein